jgi:putative mRNA 3-end processing factor
MALRSTDILTQTSQGLYCPLGDFHIDPIRPVKRALITHGHSDHARSGHRAVMATRETLRIMGVRYGEDFAGSTQAAPLGESLRVGDVSVRFTPAGHVLGSAQISIEAGGTRIVVSGDYKRAEDPTCLPYEVVPCDVFITEATFGLPVFRHPDTREEVRKLLASVALFPERAHIVGAYALGKAQRVMALLREEGCDQPIYLHGAMSPSATPRRWWPPSAPSSRAPSCCALPPPSRICGPAAFRTRSRVSRPAGCGSAPGPGRRGWSSPS